jgi:hypothetical protein
VEQTQALSWVITWAHIILFECIAYGLMLWSQFSVIFANFRQKNWRFLTNQCCDQLSEKTNSNLSKKRRDFRHFLAKFLKNHYIGPSSAAGARGHKWKVSLKRRHKMSALSENQGDPIEQIFYVWLLAIGSPWFSETSDKNLLALCGCGTGPCRSCFHSSDCTM